MTTPNLTAGVIEVQKPQRLGRAVVWRYEAALAGGGTISSPIFDVVPDGNPYTDVEVTTFQVIRVPSNRFTIYLEITTTDGMRLKMLGLRDVGSSFVIDQVYCMLPDQQATGYEFVCSGRRCQFQLQNQPLTSIGSASTTTLEILNGGDY